MSTFNPTLHPRAVDGQFAPALHADDQDVDLDEPGGGALRDGQGTTYSPTELGLDGGRLRLVDLLVDGHTVRVDAVFDMDPSADIRRAGLADSARDADVEAYAEQHRGLIEDFHRGLGLEPDGDAGWDMVRTREYPAGTGLDGMLDDVADLDARVLDDAPEGAGLASTLREADREADAAAESTAQTAAWTDGDLERELGDWEGDAPEPWEAQDLSESARHTLRDDSRAFYDQAHEILHRRGIEPAQWGHDLWLTRNGHGAGFWDRGLGEDGERLTRIARDMGEIHGMRGDDGRVELE